MGCGWNFKLRAISNNRISASLPSPSLPDAHTHTHTHTHTHNLAAKDSCSQLFLIQLTPAPRLFHTVLHQSLGKSLLHFQSVGPPALVARVLKHWTIGKVPTPFPFGVNVHMQVHIQRRLLNQYCPVLPFCSTVYMS